MAEAQLRELRIPNCKHLVDKLTVKPSLDGRQPEFLLGNPLTWTVDSESQVCKAQQSAAFTLSFLKNVYVDTLSTTK